MFIRLILSFICLSNFAFAEVPQWRTDPAEKVKRLFILNSLPTSSIGLKRLREMLKIKVSQLSGLSRLLHLTDDPETEEIIREEATFRLAEALALCSLYRPSILKVGVQTSVSHDFAKLGVGVGLFGAAASALDKYIIQPNATETAATTIGLSLSSAFLLAYVVPKAIATMENAEHAIVVKEFVWFWKQLQKADVDLIALNLEIPGTGLALPEQLGRLNLDRLEDIARKFNQTLFCEKLLTKSQT